MREVIRPVVAWVFALLIATSLSGRAGASDGGLIQAVKDGQLEAVRALLAQKADVARPELDGATALHWAARRDAIEIARLLLAAGAPVNAKDRYGVSPLALACINRSEGMLNSLLAAGADPNAATSMGESALMTCARTGSAGGVTALLKSGASNINTKEASRGQTALMWAAAQGHAEIVRILLEYRADVHMRSDTRSVFVTLGGRDDEDAINLEHGGYTPLLFAARSGDPESARLLINAGSDVNEKAPNGESALVVAAFSDNGKVAAVLLERGADPNAAGAGYAALHAAVLRGDRELVKALLASGADPNVRLTKGSRVWRTNDRWQLPGDWASATPFLLAARFAEVEMMKLLAAGGADVRLSMEDGTTPLSFAAGQGWGDVRLDRRGRTIPSELGDTVRVHGERLNLEATKTVIELGADVNATNNAGETALHGAVRKAWSMVVQVLVDHGGNLDLKNKRGKSPRDMMCFEGDKLVLCPTGGS